MRNRVHRGWPKMSSWPGSWRSCPCKKASGLPRPPRLWLQTGKLLIRLVVSGGERHARPARSPGVRSQTATFGNNSGSGSVTVMLVPRPPGPGPAWTRPLWVTTIFWTSARPSPVPSRLVVKNGRNTRSRSAGVDAGPVVEDLHPQHAGRHVGRGVDAHVGHDPFGGARLDGVAGKVAQCLPQQHLVAVDDRPRAADHQAPAARDDVGLQFVGDPLRRSARDRPGSRPAVSAARS